MIDFWELMSSRHTRSGRDASAVLVYFVRGTIDEPVVRTTMLANVPPVYGDLVLQSLECEPVGYGMWHVSAYYGLAPTVSTTNPGVDPGGGSSGGTEPGPSDALGAAIVVSIGHRTQHITQSLYTADKAQRSADTRPLPDFKGAIGVSRDGVEGCDIIVPELTWQEEWSFVDAYITWAYAQRLYELVGRVNHAKFRSFEPGEVMFLGAQLDRPTSGIRKITYSFRAERNVTNFKLTPEFNSVNKEGHQYLWVSYEDDVSGDNLLRIPRAVYVEEVGRPGGMVVGPDNTNKANFALLGIGK